eukprot:SAG11_NODE_126_length_15729_cov_9.966859_19_plen_73_part_00
MIIIGKMLLRGKKCFSFNLVTAQCCAKLSISVDLPATNFTWRYRCIAIFTGPAFEGPPCSVQSMCFAFTGIR